MKNKLYALFKEQIDNKECFGGAAAVIEKGEVLFWESFGDERFNENSIYRLASVTKLFTATALMTLYDAGKLDIYDKVSKYLPGFERLSLGALSSDGSVHTLRRAKREITIFDLLTHTAGLGADSLGNREYSVIPEDQKTSLEKICNYYAVNFHLAFEPGERCSYSGFAGYDVIARIIEIVSGICFNDYLQKAVCRPLSMADTTYRPTEEQYMRLVPVHQRISGEDREANFRGRLFRGIDRDYEAGGAALISSMGDTIKFCKMLTTGGLLSKKAIELMLTPQLESGLEGLENGENRGCGSFVYKNNIAFCHGAYGTHIVIDREREMAAVFFKNSLFDMSLESKSTLEFEKAIGIRE